MTYSAINYLDVVVVQRLDPFVVFDDTHEFGFGGIRCELEEFYLVLVPGLIARLLLVVTLDGSLSHSNLRLKLLVQAIDYIPEKL